MKKLLIAVVCGIALFGCNQALELQGVANEQAGTDYLDVSKVQLSEDSPLQDMGDYYLLGDDMIIAKDDPLTADLIAELSGDLSIARGIMLTSDEKWENGKIPYYFATGHINRGAEVEYGSTFTAEEKEYIRKQMTLIESYCNVDFYEAYPDTHYSRASRTRSHAYAIFKDATMSGGYSTVGYQTYNYLGINHFSGTTVLHELLHCLGLKHEHQHPYRDNFIECTSTDSAIIDKFTNSYSWKPLPKSATHYFLGTNVYDYASIMNYDESWLRAKNGVDIKGNQLSDGDKRSLRALYGNPQFSRHQVFLGDFSQSNGKRLTEEIIIATDKTLSLYTGDTFKLRHTAVTGSFLRDFWSSNNTWRLNLETDKFYKFGLNSAGLQGMIVVSDWGIGLIESRSGMTLRTRFIAKNGTRFGSWNYNSTTDEIVAIEDFDGDHTDEILIRSPWGIGILKYDAANTTFKHIAMAKFGNRYDGWNLGSDHKLIRFGDFNRDSKTDIVIESGWGLGIMTLDGNNNWDLIMGKPFGTWFGGWHYYKGQVFPANGNFDGLGGDDLLVRSTWGYGILSLENGTLVSKMCKPNSQIPGFLEPYGYDIDYIKDDYYVQKSYTLGISSFNRSRRDELLTMFLAYPGGQRELYRDLMYRLNGNNLEISSEKSLTNYFNPVRDSISNMSDFDKDGVADFAIVKPDGGIKIVEYNYGSFQQIRSY